MTKRKDIKPKKQQLRNFLMEIWERWPGDESIDEILSQLKGISMDYYPINLSDIAEDLEVVEPIHIVIERNKDEVIADFPAVKLFGVGANEAEAINNLKKEIKELYYDLVSTPDEQLGVLPQAWKDILNRKIKVRKEKTHEQGI